MLEKVVFWKCNKSGIRWLDNCELYNRMVVFYIVETLCKFFKFFVFGYWWYFKGSLIVNSYNVLFVGYGYFVGFGISS